MGENDAVALSAGLPLYSHARRLLTILGGVQRTSVTGMNTAIWRQMGTPQEPLDWSTPEVWIAERLTGEHASLARRIWDASEHCLNPRYVLRPYRFLSRHDLLMHDATGVLRITSRGQAFLTENPGVVREIDEAEGLVELLVILSTKTRATRGELLPEWESFLVQHSNFGMPSTIKDTLRLRLRNLTERSLVLHTDELYAITPAGQRYLTELPRRELPSGKRDVLRTVNDYNQQQREGLRQRLNTMHPYQFEHLVGQLLDAMGYDDVTVTSQGGDKGVDVVATAQFGITTIREVVQVKRREGNIPRPVIDQLRGVLPYHSAIRGTLITTGDFSAGCTEAAVFPGAPPIGLINGEKLLDMLIEHQIGIRKRAVELYELVEIPRAGLDGEPADADNQP
jgi:restriction system protein